MSQKKSLLITEIRDYIMIGIAMISYGIGWNIFLLPNSIATGGVPGVASVIFWGLHVPVQVSYFVINAVLLLFALKILGFKFCIKTIYAVFLLTTLTAAFQKYGGGTTSLLWLLSSALSLQGRALASVFRSMAQREEPTLLRPLSINTAIFRWEKW